MIRWTLEVVFLTIFMVTFTNCYTFSNDGWNSLSSPYLSNQNVDLVDYDRLSLFEDLPDCEVPDDYKQRINLNLRMCNYRGGIRPEFLYKWATGQGCYIFTPPASFNPNEPKARIGQCLYSQMYTTTCFFIDSVVGTLCYPVDPKIPQVVAEVERTLANKLAVDKWFKCSESAMDCCRNYMDGVPENNNSTCPPIWDGWSCWPEGKVGHNATQVCSEFAYSNQGPKCNHFSQKMCYLDDRGNATWNQQSDYSTCSVTPRLIHRNIIHVALLGTSVIFCTPAIIIMLAYKRLRTERLAMHRNLLIFIVLRNVIMIIIKSVVIENELTVSDGPTIMYENGFWCRFLSTMEKFAASATFTCMLVDGLQLHRRIVAVFKKALNPVIVYSIAAAITLLPIIAWICVMSLLNDSNCWLVYFEPGIQWILDVPRVAILFINTLLLLDILRVILTKLNRQENTFQLSTAKATLFLMPLFGVQFLLTAWRPATDSCPWEQAYYIFTYVMESLQGILVAILYCYWNKEVHNLIRITYKKTETIVSTHFAKSANRRRTTLHNLNRRDTCSTMVPETSQRPSVRDISVNQDGDLRTGSQVQFADQAASPEEIFRDSFYSAVDDGLIHLDFEHDSDTQSGAFDSGCFGQQTVNVHIEGYGDRVDLWTTAEASNQANMYFKLMGDKYNVDTTKS